MGGHDESRRKSNQLTHSKPMPYDRDVCFFCEKAAGYQDPLKHVKAWLISNTDCRKDKTVFGLFLSQGELKIYHKQNLVSLNSLRCLCGDHVTCDITGLLKMNYKMGQG